MQEVTSKFFCTSDRTRVPSYREKTLGTDDVAAQFSSRACNILQREVTDDKEVSPAARLTPLQKQAADLKQLYPDFILFIECT